MKRRNARLSRPYIARFYRGNHLRYACAAVASVLLGAANLALSALMKELIDTISGAPGAFALRTLTLLTGALLLSLAAVSCLNSIAMPAFMARAMRQYKDYVFEKLSGKSIASFREEAAASYVSALTNDASSIEQGFLSSQFDLMRQLLTGLGALALMIAYSPMLTLIAAALSALPMAASMLAGNRLAQAEQRVSDRNGRFVATVSDSLNGFSVVKSFQAERAILSLFARSNADLEDARRSRRRVACVVGGIGSLAGAAAQLGVFIAGAYLALAGRGVSAGVVLAFVNLMNFVIQPISEAPGILVLKGGRLEEAGTFEELMARRGYFYSLFTVSQ